MRRYAKSAKSILGDLAGIVGYRNGVSTNEQVLGTTSYPVFYDKTGKRLFHLVVIVFVSVLISMILPVRVIPIALDPLWVVPTNHDSGFPRKFLATEVRDLPILGGEQPTAFSRIVRIDRHQEEASSGRLPATQVDLVDPFTNELYRSATENEKRTIGDSAYALEHFGQPADRQLMLTFDDGSDIKFTTQMLDILAREGVPATFFSTGSNIVQHPDVFKRIVRDGHMAGNRTIYRVDFDKHTDIRNRTEIIATDRVMRATAGYASRLFRIPTGDPDKHILALLQAQQLGYLEVDNQIDTENGKVAPGNDIAVPQLDGRGRVVLLHDAGDRGATVRMVENLIGEAKREGYTFTTLAPLLPPQYIPAKNVEPSPADLVTYHTLEFVEMAPGMLRGFLFWLGIGSLTIRAMLFRPKYGVSGTAALPYAARFQQVPLLFMSLAIVAPGRSLAEGNWRSIALFAALVAILHMIISITAVAIPRARPWHLLVALSTGRSKRSSSHRAPTAGGRSTPATAPRRFGRSAAPTSPVRAGSAVSSDKFPVFYDRSGKRLRRVNLAVLALLCAIAGVVAWFIPAAFAPTLTQDNDPGFARRQHVVDSGLVSVGDTEHGVLSRMVRVERKPSEPVRLLDAATGEYIRDATEAEAIGINDSLYAIDYFTTVPDHTLMVTFDDGPDPVWTPQILEILSREHVPATFFVMGSLVAQHPEIIQRMIREGHMVGNHTITHPQLDTQTDERMQAEIVDTDRIIRAAADYASPIFRMPYGDPDTSPVAQLQSQKLGYLHIYYDLDTNDWKYEGEGKEVPIPKLDGRGHVVIMHDAGGHSRAGTVKALGKLIAEAKAQGYTFTTLAPILPPKSQPQKNIAPSLTDRATLLAAQTIYVAPHLVLPAVIAISLTGVLVLTVFYLMLSSINEWRQRRRKWPEVPVDELPFVSVVLAAYNEEKVITRTLDALRASDYPADHFEVIAVNDGSTDDTAAVLEDYARQWPQLRVLHQENSGKSWALNNGIGHADSRSTVVITLDADTLFRRTVISRLARHFHDERVGVVAGHVKVGNRRNVLTAWQSLEYLNGICVVRMAEMMVGAITVVPGACSAWRRDLLDQIGGFSHDTLAEDADAAMALQRMRYRVLHDNLALCDTEAPETVRLLLKQRKRWMFGNFQVMWKNKRMLFRPRYGVLGMVTMPYAVFTIFLNLAFLPFLFVTSVIALAEGMWQPLSVATAIFLISSAITPVLAVVIAREKWWHLAVIIIHRPIYEVLRLYLLYACTYRVIKGAEFAWDKLERRNSVVATEPAERMNDAEVAAIGTRLVGAYDNDSLRHVAS